MALTIHIKNRYSISVPGEACRKGAEAYAQFLRMKKAKMSCEKNQHC